MAFRIFAFALLVPGLAELAAFPDAQAFLGRPAVPMAEQLELARTESQLRPIFSTFHLNGHDGLDSAGARYLMYRHFLHQYGWQMRGLVPDGDAWGRPFPLQFVEDRKWQQTIRSSLANRGLSLREAAVLAGVLKKQVQEDAVDRLHHVWLSHGLKPEESTRMEVMDSVLDMHMATYILPDVWKLMQTEVANDYKIRSSQQMIVEIYPTWPRTQTFLRKASEGVEEDNLDLGAAQRLLLRVLDLFGHWQDQECDGLKQKLLHMESSRPGRVELARFYGEAVKSDQWMFSETLPYLRQLGALDDSDPAHPSVLIPNYINSASNHLGESRYFELGCIDECQELLGHMERRLGAPTATGAQILAVARRLPSPSHPEREVIPDDLLNKLKEISVAHQGQVPLHGRLFAQWLHHMYPRDCPYPHAAGVTKQEQVEEYEARTRTSASETNESMIRIISSLEGSTQVQTSTALPWDLHEEALEPPAPKLGEGRITTLPLLLAGAASGTMMALSLLAGRRLLGATGLAGAVLRGPLLDVDGTPQSVQTTPAEASACQAQV